jgi:hypothetical protein
VLLQWMDSLAKHRHILDPDGNITETKSDEECWINTEEERHTSNIHCDKERHCVEDEEACFHEEEMI